MSKKTLIKRNKVVFIKAAKSDSQKIIQLKCTSNRGSSCEYYSSRASNHICNAKDYVCEYQKEGDENES